MPPTPAVTLDRRLKIMQWNANGLNAHKIELKAFLASQSGELPDVICIQETF